MRLIGGTPSRTIPSHCNPRSGTTKSTISNCWLSFKPSKHSDTTWKEETTPLKFGWITGILSISPRSRSYHVIRPVRPSICHISSSLSYINLELITRQMLCPAIQTLKRGWRMIMRSRCSWIQNFSLHVRCMPQQSPVKVMCCYKNNSRQPRHMTWKSAKP